LTSFSHKRQWWHQLPSKGASSDTQESLCQSINGLHLKKQINPVPFRKNKTINHCGTAALLLPLPFAALHILVDLAT